MQKDSNGVDKVVIRKAKPGDYEKVKEMLVSSGQTTSKVFTKKRFDDTLKDFSKYNLVAQRGKAVVGYIFGFDDSGRSGKPKFYGYIGRLIVDPEHRNLGIGNALVERCLSEFKKFGYTNVFVGIHRLNIGSKSLFEKRGFRDDDLLLLRFLDL